MNLGPEDQRPHRTVLRKHSDGSLHQSRVPLTDEEWAELKERGRVHAELMAEKAKSKYLEDREDAYKEEIYPFMDNARMLAELEGDKSKLDELKKKKKDIDDRFPKPEEQK